MPATIVAFGGTGVIGTALRRVASRLGVPMLTLSLDPNATDAGWTNLHLDFDSAPAGALTSILTAALPEGAPIRAICSIAGLASRQIAEVAAFAAARGAPLVQISSCLLYQADIGSTVDEGTPTLTLPLATFPYLQLKLAEEAALTARGDADWRILRTNHVLGPGSLLGCIPDHNRDPALLARLRAGQPLQLTKAGRLRVSWVHAEDLALAMLGLCADPTTAGQILNVVHPQPAMADAYYRQISTLLGLPPPAIQELLPEVADFWALTARDIHFTSRHPAVQRLTFHHDLASALKDTLSLGEHDYAGQGGHLRDRLGRH